MKLDKHEIEFNKIIENLSYENIKQLEDSHILLTGASGFIGTWFINFFSFLNKHVLERPCNVLCAVHNSKIEHAAFIKTIKIDLTKTPATELEKYKLDYIVHCAAISSPEDYKTSPVKTLDLSYVGTKNILEIAKKQGVKSVLCFSSAAVYGDPTADEIPTKEHYIGKLSPFSDRSSYAVGKYALEALCYAYYKQYNIPVKMVRPFNIYGPGMAKNNVMIKFINKILDSEPITIYGDGKQSRSFCYIADAISAFIKILLEGHSGDVYNVGDQESEKTMIGLANLLLKLSHKEVNIQLMDYPDNYPKNEPRRSVPNMTKTRELGFENRTRLQEGINTLLADIKNDLQL